MQQWVPIALLTEYKIFWTIVVLSTKYRSVCILVLVIRHANRVFPVQHYIVISGLSGCIIFVNIIS
jgi:hypothetical protein